MRALCAIGALTWLQPSAAAGSAERARDSFFLSSGAPPPHREQVPLAVVHGSVVVDAVARAATWPAPAPRDCGSRTRWATVGSRWHALDGWGQIIGDAQVSSRSIYDVTRCAELTMSKLRGAGENTLYVSLDSAWRPAAPAAFTPSAAVAAAFARLVAVRLDDRSVEHAPLPPECAALAERVRFFTGPAGARYAVGTSNVGYLVAKLEQNRWSAVTTQVTSPHEPGNSRCYRPVAVFDMNGDGTPEIVLRQSAGEAWGDLVLGRAADGAWPVVALSPGSALI
jgi:hypothetical protein